jgi:L-rhamnose mutarotase
MIPKRVAFKMKLKPDSVAEYKRRHQEIWPEIEQILTESGIYNYSIFLDEETSTLFAVHDIDKENTALSIGSDEIVKKWWDYNANLMEVNHDNSPIVNYLEEIFYLP